MISSKATRRKGKPMKNERKISSTEVQKQISKLRNLYESIGESIDFETAVDLSLHLGKALEMARPIQSDERQKRRVM